MQSELRRFHRGISLALLLLSVIILTVEILRHHELREWILLAMLLTAIGYSTSKLSVSFWEREGESY